jgi:hypothetical protein
MSRLIFVLRAAVPALVLAAAPVGHASPSGSTAAAPAKPAAHVHAADRSPVASPVVLVHKSPSCSCCKSWVEHLRKAGFTVQVDETTDIGAVKERVGIPPAKGSCHTAEVAGYFVEGHVPAQDIRRLLAGKPDARGLTAPGMPIGSPGMEVAGQGTPKYTVELVRKDGSTAPFAVHGDGVEAGAHHEN